VSIGVTSFLLPFLAAFGFCGLVLRWRLHAAEIGGIALSTTSVAVVYAVMVETGLNRHDLGKLILAACFVTDLGTVLALGGLFASYGWLLLLVCVAVSAVTVALLPGCSKSPSGCSDIAFPSRRSSSCPWCCSHSAASPPRPEARQCYPPTWPGSSSRVCSCTTGCSWTGCAPLPSRC
jgi:hypothetical protein